MTLLAVPALYQFRVGRKRRRLEKMVGLKGKDHFQA